MAQTVLLFGAGVPDGVGGAIAQRFASEGLHIIVTGRTIEKVEQTTAHLKDQGLSAETMACDVTDNVQVTAVFDRATALGQPVASVIFNAGYNWPIKFEDITPDQFENFWRIGCFGGFLVAKQAMPLLAGQGAGSALFTGASASVRGKPNFAHFSAAKGGLRNMVQALAREYGPQGVHVAHIIIDGIVSGDRIKTLANEYLDKLGEDGALSPAAIAETFWSIHTQPRSAWTQEIDLRPFKETW